MSGLYRRLQLQLDQFNQGNSEIVGTVVTILCSSCRRDINACIISNDDERIVPLEGWWWSLTGALAWETKCRRCGTWRVVVETELRALRPRMRGKNKVLVYDALLAPPRRGGNPPRSS